MVRPTAIHAFGDSLTAGIADVWTNSKLTPWPRILFDALRSTGADVVLTSDLARVGASSREVLSEQIQPAEIGSGDVVCLWVGGNDTLRSKYTIEDTHLALGEVLGVIGEAGAVPLTMELPRISSALPGPRWAMRSWDAQGALVNEMVRAGSGRLNGIHIDWPGPSIAGPDGTHLSQAGHYFYAREYATRLAARWGIATPRIEAPEGLPVFSAADRRRWYLKHGWLWLMRRRIDKRRAARR